ncbi:unnamed protein product [Callosobruchus maculatus]|uniref:PH domain-containing protein n=1 Tax=Callosobruchus maculatus TaxID=64391 RepID=A0A653BN23_CALMS|nr:unnamed protein product [Callosobruchus maculatus]
MAGVSSAGGGMELSGNGGRALKLHTDTPHLVSMGGDRLSTSVTLHPIPKGRVTIGSGSSVDVHVQGRGVQALHCSIENSEGVVTIYPIEGEVQIDGVPIDRPTRLSQGVMLTVGRSNYLRFNHPAEARLMKSVLPNPRISMAPINFEPGDYSHQSNTTAPGAKKPPSVPRKSPRESLDSSGGEEPPSSIATKVSKFEYLAAQNLKKSISPKVFPANVATVNMPMKDVIGKAPPDLNRYAKSLPQSALNYWELNYTNKPQEKKQGQEVFSKKSSHYVNVAVDETKNVNNKVMIFENNIPANNQNVNFDFNDLNNKTASMNKNINLSKMNMPSPNFNRNPVVYRSVTPSLPSKITKSEHRRSGSLGELNVTCTEGEQAAQRKYDAELRRNQAHQDRVREQEIEKAEQQRLEEILNMCVEYEKQTQYEKNKPVTPNRIKTNGSLPRDKRGQYAPPSPSYSTSPPLSPLDLLQNELLKHNNSHNYENINRSFCNTSNDTTEHRTPNLRDNSDHMHLKSPDQTSNEYRNLERSSPYENVLMQQGVVVPSSPRTRIKTFVTSNKDNATKESTELIDNKFAILEAEQILLREAEQVLRQNLHNSKEFPPDHDIFDIPEVKTAPTKFIFPEEDSSASKDISSSVDDKKSTNNDGANSEKNFSDYKDHSEADKRRVEQLKKERKDILSVISRVKRQMSEIEVQEEELHRGLELEKALVAGEHKSKLLELENFEARRQKLQKSSQNIEDKMRDRQAKQGEDQKECKKKLKLAQENMSRVENKMSVTDKTSPKYEEVFEEYLQAQEQLDNERKTFEDLEFHHLEEEADWLASREEMQREIIDLSNRIEHLKVQIRELEQQMLNASKINSNEFKSIEKHKMECRVRLEEVRNRMKCIDDELSRFSNEESEPEISSDTDSDRSRELDNALSKVTDLSCSVIVSYSKIPDDNMSQSFNEKLLQEKSILECGIERKFPSQDDIDRISKVTSDAPISIEVEHGSLGRKTIESLKEIEKNRHLHLCQQGSQVIEQERQRVRALKERVQKEVKSKWAQRVQDCNSFNSVENDASRESDADDEQQDSTKPDLDEKERKQSHRSESEQPDSPRPLSDTSEMSLETGTLNRKRKPVGDKQRPLTRYLPIRGSDLDLKQHIESAGHQVVLCPHVIINSITCRGFLHKKGSKLNSWSRRWFVFDRSKHTFTYYLDKSEKKPRGGAYFQAIEEVYLDHLNSVKSPNPHLTFIVKTHERLYYLMAPSPEAMRIWVDVIFTGAEGYREFERDS